jgi:hypothetical protein
VFDNLDNVKEWLADFVRLKLNKEIVKSITNMELYNKQFFAHFEI